jgi:hypothetical protein
MPTHRQNYAHLSDAPGFDIDALVAYLGAAPVALRPGEPDHPGAVIPPFGPFPCEAARTGGILAS